MYGYSRSHRGNQMKAAIAQNLAAEIPGVISGAILAQRKNQEPLIDFSLLQGGFAKGSLVEIAGSPGSGKTEVVLKLLAENPELRVAWVEEGMTVYPCAFPQHHVELKRILFVDV